MATLCCTVYVLDFLRVNLEGVQTKYSNLSTHLYGTVMSSEAHRRNFMLNMTKTYFYSSNKMSIYVPSYNHSKIFVLTHSH